MSAYGRNLSFSITLAAKDDSQSGLRSASQRILSFAKRVAKPIMIPFKVGRRGLAFMRDIELGLRPVLAGIDRLIERGSGLEVVSKSFEALTETGGKQTQTLARQLRDAASGTIRLGEAMEVANRGLASGLSFDQLITAMDFVSKKAITTGMNAAGAIDKVITGLSRGSVLFLDDFGLVVDGIEGIARDYDKIKGTGAFDSLGPAAQKAAIVTQAIKEMRQQLGKIGVSGKESVFLWQGLKNQIGDAVDKLVLAVAKSKALQDTLKGLRNILSGITRYLEEGKNHSIWDVLLGKKNTEGKRSGGLLGIAKAAALDAGEWIGRGILGGLLVGISEIPDLFSRVWDKLQGILDDALAAIPEKIQAGIDWLKGRFPDVAAAHTGITNTVGEWISDKLGLFNKGMPDGTVRRGLVDGWGDAASMLEGEHPLTWVKAFGRGVHRALDKIFGGEDPGPLKLRREDPGAPRASAVPTSKEGFFAMAAGASATATTKGAGPSWFELAGKAGRKILTGGDYRFGKAVDTFLKQFPPRTPEAYKFHVEKDELPLTPRGRVMREQENVLAGRRIRKAEADVRREARTRAAEEVRRLRLQGYDATHKRGEIERRILDELLGRSAEIAAGRSRIEENKKALATDGQSRQPSPASGPIAVDKSLDALVKAVRANTQQSKQVYAALTGASSQLGQSM